MKSFERARKAVVPSIGVVVVGVGLALAGNPNFDQPTGDIRADAPDEPRFDRAEPDDASGHYVSGTSVFDEMWKLFGFAPFTTQDTAVYSSAQPKANGAADPLTEPGAGQISGVRADRAWQITRGVPEAVVAVLDTGILWNDRDLRRKIHLNRNELPLPAPGGVPCLTHDCDGDGALTPDDYAGDPNVHPDGGPNGVPGALDAQDLLVAFSDGIDDDGNGYVDDIAGWDFFDDDNDAFDASSHASSENHGRGRTREAAAETNNGADDVGVCPRCTFMPLRVWDTFVVDSNSWGLATIYAADNGAVATENAVGALTNAPFAKAATAWAVEKGVAIMAVSSDLNTANHNYPTNYDDTIFVSGIVPDAPEEGETPPDGFPFPLPLGANVPVGTWFRDSGLTQYGAHHHLNMMGSTGSQATGQAAGAAGLLASRGLELAAEGVLAAPLTANEVKQILTMTAEDVVPSNTLGLGLPDPSQPGWDQHFGYGRVDLGAAVAAVGPGTIPPEVSIHQPPWFHIIDPDAERFDLAGDLRALRPGGAPLSAVVEIGPGIEPLDGQFVEVARLDGEAAPLDEGTLASIPVDAVKSLFPPATDFTAPPLAAGPPLHGQAAVPSNQYLFTVRVRVTDALGNLAEDRRALFLHRNRGLHPGWPKFIDVGGEAAIKMADLGHCDRGEPGTGPGQPRPFEPDGKLELIVATSGGVLHVWCGDGREFPGFPVEVDPQTNALAHAAAPGLVALGLPRSSIPTPAVGDLDGDGKKEIIAAAGEKVYVWSWEGARVAPFPVSIDLELSKPEVRTKTNHLKTGIFASPALGNLHQNLAAETDDRTLDIVVAAMDGHVYVWAADGSLRPGFPARLIDLAQGTDAVGTESITTPTLADLDGDGRTDVVVASNEVYGDGFDPSEFQAILEGLANPPGLPSALAGALTDQVLTQAGGSTRVYALRSDGTLLAGWPVKIAGLAPDALPLVGPGFMAAAADLDEDPATVEIVTGATLGNLGVFRHDGTRLATMLPAPFGPGSDVVDPSAALNLFEYPTLADLDGDGVLDVIKGGITAAGAANLVLTGQNFAFSHAILAWNSKTGTFLPRFPKATDDFMLLTQPAVADVGSPIPGLADGRPEIVAGTGLYLLHAYDSMGAEPAGWPKLLGGWIFGTPAVGDVDGDGRVEVAASTREGYVFLFDTDGGAGDNVHWWTYHHDEHNSGFVGTDPR